MSVEVVNDIITIRNPVSPGTKASISRLGSTLISLEVKDKEYIYLSDKANVSVHSQIPVRGGVPVIFPAFGKSYLESLKTVQQHGFARNLAWDFVVAEVLDDKTIAKFKFTEKNCADHPGYKKWCEYYGSEIKFELSLIFELYEESLNIKTSLLNINIPKLEFQFLFHSYFRVPSVKDMYITGLQGTKHVDRLKVKYHREDVPMVKVTEQTDKLYRMDNFVETVDILSGDNIIRLSGSENLRDLVIWNPWIEGAEKMKDFEPKESYLNMCCVEFGSVEGETVEKGKTWNCEHLIEIL